MEEPRLGIPKLGPVIAIDGPAGTGKSTATRRLADRLGFVHIDTGALYRAIAWLVLERMKVVPGNDFAAVAMDIAGQVHLEFRRQATKNPANRVFANGQDVTDYIRTPEVTMTASQVSSIPQVRASLLGLQRRLGCQGKSILEGRDIGTVVFPDADVKFFLNASVDERAKRRLIELEAAGSDAPSFEEVRSQIEARDRIDSTRAVAPLKKASDSIEVDTSQMTLDQVVDTMEKWVNSRIK